MSVATERPAARRVREPGTPPGSLVALASLALVAGTGAALWLLPSGIPGPPARAWHPAPAAPPPGARPAAAGAPGRISRPSGFVTFVDAAGDPPFALPEAVSRDHVRWFTLGHLTAGADGCTPGWSGHGERDGERDGAPVASGLGRLRAAGGDAGLAFGGPSGRELATTCTDQKRLVEAYRRVVGAFGAGYIDFEIRERGDEAAVLRRADAIATLQREGAAASRPLTVSFTLPANGSGLSNGDQEMLRTTRDRGAEISAVNLLVPIRGGHAGRSRLRPIASAVQAAHPQITRSLGGSGTWHRIALSPVLAGSGDLTSADARRLVAFSARKGMAWLSTRGASPSSGVSRLLTNLAR
ncbi:hypothetical protein AB0395_25360 [Streptosporangium sp. NPDC051023]|uniref:hypothetical protein n=1 Tax=Streptosporangium sp. NPDC051023 TaxID=3155410 RepID=UPI00344E78D4